MNTTPVHPGRTGYVVALVLLLIGIIGAVALIALFIFSLSGIGDDLERMVGPGTEQMVFSESGNYTIYYENESVVDGQHYSSQVITRNLDVQVTRVADNTPIMVHRQSGWRNYRVDDYAGWSIRSFEVDVPGTYEITATYVDGSEEPQFVLAIGRGVLRQIVTSIGAFLGAGIVFCLFTLIAIAIAGITLLRRIRAARTSGDPAAHPPV